jgi:hypothetical protein
MIAAQILFTISHKRDPDNDNPKQQQKNEALDFAIALAEISSVKCQMSNVKCQMSKGWQEGEKRDKK